MIHDLEQWAKQLFFHRKLLYILEHSPRKRMTSVCLSRRSTQWHVHCSKKKRRNSLVSGDWVHQSHSKNDITERSLGLTLFKEFDFEDNSILQSPWDKFLFCGGEKSLLVRTVQGDPKGLEFKQQQKKCEQQQRMLGEIMLVLSEEKWQRFKNECSWIFWCLAQFPERNYGQLQLRTKHYSVVCSWIF